MKINSNRINNIPSNFIRKSTGKKLQQDKGHSIHSNNKDKSRDFQERICHTSNTPSKNINEKTNTENNNNSNIILNQNHSGMPCYNNINIYTNGISSMKNNSNTGDSTLKNYINNKVNHKKSPSMSRLNNKSKGHHSKSNSIIGKL